MSPKNKEIKQRGNSETQSYEKHEKTCRKSDVKIIEKSLKKRPNIELKSIKNLFQKSITIDAEKSTDLWPIKNN